MQSFSIHSIYNLSMLTLKQYPRSTFFFYSRIILLSKHTFFKHPKTIVIFNTNKSLVSFRLSFYTAHKISMNCKAVCVDKRIFYLKSFNFYGKIFASSLYLFFFFLRYCPYFNIELFKPAYKLLNFANLCVLKRNTSMLLDCRKKICMIIDFSMTFLNLPWHFYHSTLLNTNLRCSSLAPITVINKVWIF